MSRATAQFGRFAERLIAFDARQKRASDANLSAAFPVCEKLRPHLATLMGTAGVRSLLSPAVAVTRAEVGCVNAVANDADSSLRVLNAPDVQAGPVIAGMPGCGKTTMAQRITFANAPLA